MLLSHSSNSRHLTYLKYKKNNFPKETSDVWSKTTWLELISLRNFEKYKDLDFKGDFLFIL